MKLQSLMIILTLIFFAFGCSSIDKFKTASNADSNVAATPKPSATAL